MGPRGAVSDEDGDLRAVGRAVFLHVAAGVNGRVRVYLCVWLSRGGVRM